MNGQPERRRIIVQLIAEHDFKFVVETGTYYGTTTLFLADVVNAPVVTVETSPRYAKYSQRRFASRRDITVCQGLSEEVLPDVLGKFCPADELGLFYLDAHWHSELPLATELELISDHCTKAMVLIDDFCVPLDKGYAYDTYGGTSLALDLIPASLDQWCVSFPCVPSEAEGGARRGFAVIFPESLKEGVQRVDGLTNPVDIRTAKESWQRMSTATTSE